MDKKQIFSRSEKRVISAMYQLDRWATIYEISEWAENMSWNTTDSVLRILKRKGIVQSKITDRKMQWKIKE